MMGQRLWPLLSLLLPFVAKAQTPAPGFQEGGAGWKMVSLDLDVSVTKSGGLAVVGHARLRAEEAGSHGPNLVLRRGEMRFDSAKAPRGARADIQSSGAAVSIRYPTELPIGTEIEVETVCSKLPRSGRRLAANADGAFASWGGGGVWYPIPSSGPGPYRNGDAPGKTKLTVPASWLTLSSGRKVSGSILGDSKTDVWETKNDLGRSFICAPFHILQTQKGGREISTYFLEKSPAKASVYADWAAKVIAVLEPRFGAFPFENYAIAVLPASLAPGGFVGRSEPGYFLGHENTLAAAQPNLPLIAHELSHSWWAIQVRCGGQGNQLLEEGMAQYAATLATEALFGGEAASRHLRLNNQYPAQMAYSSARGYFHLWRTGQDNALLPGVDGSSIPYAKGAWIYHMIRSQVGDAAFFRVLRRLVKEYSGKSLSFANLRDAFVKENPKLDVFFTEFCERAGAPVLDVDWLSESTGARVTVRQMGQVYHLPLEIAVYGASGTQVHKVELSKSVQTFSLPSSGHAMRVRVDPDNKILLWRREYGPIPGVTETESEADWRAWFDQEVQWLLSVYTDIPGISVGIVSKGRVWSKGYGFLEAGGNRPVRADTLFQAGDLSKVVSAVGALKLAGGSLDTDVSHLLKFWNAPGPATLRQLLAGTSGFGYKGSLSVAPNEVIPGLADLFGNVFAVGPPGSYSPSAANYVMLQKLIEDRAGTSFEDAIRSQVWEPFEMRSSSYDVPTLFAIGHPGDGRPLPGGYRVYPQKAALGLWTSAVDFASFLSRAMKDERLVSLLLSSQADAGSYLGEGKAGLGVIVQGRSFYQIGLNAGYTALVIAWPETGDAFVAFANDSDRAIVPLIDLAQRVALRYGWPAIPRFQ